MKREAFKFPQDKIDKSAAGIDLEVRRTEREIEIIEKRKEYAKTAVAIEEYLAKATCDFNTKITTSENTEPTSIPVAVESIMDQMSAQIESLMVQENTPWPEEMKEKFLKYAKNYVHTTVRAQRIESFLNKGENAFPKPNKNEQSEEVNGKTIFLRKTGHEPNGRVTLIRREGYFVIACADKDDYTALDPEGTRESEGGAYYESFKFDGGIIPWVITVKGNLDEEKNVYIEKHERQHWLNHAVFRNFDTLESKKGGSIPYAKTEAGIPTDVLIKDELLAYIRDGRSGEKIESYLLNGEYQDILTCDRSSSEGDKINDKNDFEKNQKLITEIVLQLDTYDTFFPDPKARSELVYMLVNIPLEKMAKYISSIIRSERIKKSDTLFSPVHKSRKK